MKTLKHIVEGIFDKSNKDNVGKAFDDDILDWVKENYKGKFYISGVKNGMTQVSSKGNVKLISQLETLTNGQFEFDHIKGHFDIHSCKPLNTFAGGPKVVDGDLKAHFCPNLNSFEGCPEKIGGVLNINSSGFKSLKGIPDAHSYDIRSLWIRSLEGLPKKVEGFVDCSSCLGLIDLVGAPREVGDRFDCSWCKSLHSLKGGPEKVGSNFQCSYCSYIETLEGAPKEVGLSVFCHNCQSLVSLKGCPQKIAHDIWIGGCNELYDIHDIPYGVHVFGKEDCIRLKYR